MSVFLPALKQYGHLENIHITVCNVGSRKIGEQDDYVSQGWGIFAPNLTIYGFDADTDACEAANADLENRQVNWTEKHIPLALGKSTGEATLYVTRHPMCSSLYQPNEAFLARFKDLVELAGLDFTVEMEVTTLDEFCQQEGVHSIDFLQIDVQGADLQVLQGASNILKTVLGVQIEVEFSPLYLDQPLFADVDTYLRSHDFSLFDLSTARRIRNRSPIVSSAHPGQLLWGDAFYLCDLLQPVEMLHAKTPQQIFKLACVADALQFSDYALELLEHLTLNYGSDPTYNFADVIIESLALFPELTQQNFSALPIVSRLRNYLTKPELKALLEPVPSLHQTPASPESVFQSPHHQRHNRCRQEHFASLGLNLAGVSVLEVGAGIGEHTGFLLNQGCQVITTEGRLENLEVLQRRYPDLTALLLDLDHPDDSLKEQLTSDVVYCYGLLYHLQHPAEAIAFMADCCRDLLLLETCVSWGEEEAINLCTEDINRASQALSGIGCRPTRKWIYNQLKQHFEFVYLPLTQPNHEEFPIDWSTPPAGNFIRSVFIASRKPLNNPFLVEEIPVYQKHH